MLRQTIDPLVREQQEIEKRRQRLEERRQRVLDVKTRTIGVDVKALQQQVEEKRARAFEEKQWELEQDKIRLQNDKIATGLALEHQRLQRQQSIETEAIRKYQAELKQQALAVEAKKAQELEKQHLSAQLMKFAGEDPLQKERFRLQQQQQQLWIEQHLTAQAGQLDQEKALKMRQDAEEAEMNRAADEMERMVHTHRAMSKAYTKQFNQQQIDLKQQTEKQKAEQEHAERIKEIEYQLNSDFLTERPGAALRTDNPQRFIRYGFKGFSPEQQQAILQQQQQQVQDAKLRQQRAKDEEASAAKAAEEARVFALKMERQMQQIRAAQEVQTRQVQLAQKKEHDARTQYLNKTVYTNAVTDSFWAQFGTSAR